MFLKIRALKERKSARMSKSSWERLNRVMETKLGSPITFEQALSAIVEYACSMIEVDKYDLQVIITPKGPKRPLEKEDQ